LPTSFLERNTVLTLVLLLTRLGRLTDTLNTELCGAFGLSASEVRVLACLRHTPGRQGTPTDLARLIVQTSGGLTATLRRLEQQGLVERRADASDGRGKLVVLTDAGVEAHDRVLAEMQSRYESMFAEIDVAAALEVVRELIGPLERAAHAVPSSAWSAAVPEGVSS
jgi:DNA-binding MarR family transcriptional regulator